MPEICRFFGIIIKMFFADHNPPHFHVEYGDYEALIDINTLAILSGSFPPRALGLVMEWALIHQKELQALWDKAQHLEPLEKIKPLE